MSKVENKNKKQKEEGITRKNILVYLGIVFGVVFFGMFCVFVQEMSKEDTAKIKISGNDFDLPLTAWTLTWNGFTINYDEVGLSAKDTLSPNYVLDVKIPLLVEETYFADSINSDTEDTEESTDSTGTLGSVLESETEVETTSNEIKKIVDSGVYVVLENDTDEEIPLEDAVVNTIYMTKNSLLALEDGILIGDNRKTIVGKYGEPVVSEVSGSIEKCVFLDGEIGVVEAEIEDEIVKSLVYSVDKDRIAEVLAIKESE